MVVPVELVSLTIDVVALASLFSICIECFDYFKAGQALEEDFELLLVKLDVEKTRLLIWGNAVGILKSEGEGRVSELNNSQKLELVGRCLESIKSLLSDTDKFQNLYGLRSSADAEKDSRNYSILSINSMSVFWVSYRRFWARFAGNQGLLTLAMRTRWAIHDKTKFEGLVHHLKGLIDGLNRVVLVKRETQDEIMHDDIVLILDISKLRLIQSACEGSYTTLSKAASSVIATSEFGTIDRRNIEEWLGDAKGMSEDGDGDAAAGPKSHETLSPDAESSTQGRPPIFPINSADTILALLFESIPGLRINYGCAPQSSETLPSTLLFSTPVTSKPFLSTSSTPKALSSAQDTPASSPPRQISHPPSPTPKRQKRSPARSVTIEEAYPGQQDRNGSYQSPNKYKMYDSETLRLDSSKREIRLLRILPGAFVSPIHCELFRTSLDGKPDYEALSYVWGGALDRRNIVVNSDEFSVTTNLELALRRLRAHVGEKPLVLWADAVCINQDCYEEKAQQVALMAEIYRKALAVLIHLGENGNNSELVEQLLYDILDADLDEASTTIVPECYDLPPHQDKCWAALSRFLERDWFRRTWVIQEFVLNNTVEVICGEWMVNGETLVEAVSKIARFTAWYRGGAAATGANLIRALGGTKSRYLKGDRPRLPSLIKSFHATDAKEERDHLFALLSLAEHGSHQNLIPEYGGDFESVRERYTQHFINTAYPFEILSLAGLHSQTSRCASWILDLTTLRDFELLLGIGTAVEKGVYRAGFGKPAVISPPGRDILSLRGVLADFVGATRMNVDPENGARDPHHTNSDEFDLIFEVLANILPYPTGEDLDDVRMRTLIGDYPWEGDGSPKTCFAALQMCSSTTDKAEREEYLSTARPYLVAHIDMMKGRKCCLTEKGYVGIVPINTRLGDAVFVPYGSPVPFVIRKIDEREANYLLVGECYIHGIMAGEAMGLDDAHHKELHFH
jgi:hypothetical protein